MTPEEMASYCKKLNTVEAVVSEIRTRAMEAKRRKASFTTESLNFVFSPETGELFVSPKAVQQNEERGLERDEFFSVGSSFSRSSSARSTEPFLSIKTNFSRCSSLSGLERGDLQPFNVHCEFWHGLDFKTCGGAQSCKRSATARGGHLV